MKVTLKKLQVFVLSAKNNSLKEAADICCISHSAASQALMELEETFGQLFDRVGKRLRLNHHGEQLYPKAKEIIDRSHELEEMTQKESSSLRGHLSIGASDTIGNYWLPQYLAQFKQRYPAIEIDLEIGNTQTIVERSHQLIFDFAFIEDKHLEQPLLIEPWINDSMAIACRSDHPLTSKDRVTLEDLKNTNWIIRELGSGTRNVTFASFEQHFSPIVEITLPTTESIKHYLLNSDCLALLSMSAIVSEIQKKIFKIIEIESFSTERSFYFIQHVNKYQSITAKCLKTFLKASIAPISHQSG